MSDWPILPDGVTLVPVGEPVCWVLAVMPGGYLVEGTGRTTAEAQADARTRWLRSCPSRFDGRYRIRQRNRRRRQR